MSWRFGLFCLFIGWLNSGCSALTSVEEQELIRPRTVPPVYPIAAMEKGVEGYVILQHTLSAKGVPQDIVVIDEVPKGYFLEVSLQALRRFRFPVETNLPKTTRYTTKITFELGKL